MMTVVSFIFVDECRGERRLALSSLGCSDEELD